MDDEPDYLYYKNNSDIAIHIVTTPKNTDTIMPYILTDVYRCTVSPNETKNSRLELNLLSESDSISIFILNKDTILNNSWNDITAKRNFLSIYVLSKANITKLSEKIKYPTIVEYPPTEEMKNMHIINF